MPPIARKKAPRHPLHQRDAIGGLLVRVDVITAPDAIGTTESPPVTISLIRRALSAARAAGHDGNRQHCATEPPCLHAQIIAEGACDSAGYQAADGAGTCLPAVVLTVRDTRRI